MNISGITKVITVYLYEEFDVCANEEMRRFTEKHTCKRHGGAGGKIRGSIKSGFNLLVQ